MYVTVIWARYHLVASADEDVQQVGEVPKWDALASSPMAAQAIRRWEGARHGRTGYGLLVAAWQEQSKQAGGRFFLQMRPAKMTATSSQSYFRTFTVSHSLSRDFFFSKTK
jgi:hypothetical protein